MVIYHRLETIEKSKLLALKVVAVTCKMWLLTTGSECTLDVLTGRNLVLIIAKKWPLRRGGRLGKVAAHGNLTVVLFMVLHAPSY